MFFAFATAFAFLSAVSCSGAPGGGKSAKPAGLDNRVPRSEAFETNAEPAAAKLVRGSHVGRNIGYATRHGGTIKLPEGMERRSNVNFADGHGVVSAVAGDAFVVFLTDEAGVVRDDVTLADMAQSSLVPECQGESTPIGVVPTDACSSAEGSVSAAFAFEYRKGQLSVLDEPVQCECFFIHDGGDADEDIP